jgi:hypothetical protein
MQNGKNAGCLSVRSDAMLPEEVAGGAVWKLHDGKAYVNAPRVRATGPCTAVQVQAWEHGREEAAEQMRQRVRGAGAVMLEGLERGEPQHDRMGLWQPMADGRLTNDRRMYWFRSGGTEAAGPWLYYTAAAWCVGTVKVGVQAGKAVGDMLVVSCAMLPEEIAEGAVWKV